MLDPLLFIMYINYLPNVTNRLFPTLLIECSNKHVIITSPNNELNRLNVWVGAYKLSINVSKTHYNIFLNNYILTKVNYTKILGIFLDNKLNWINHISLYIYILSFGLGGITFL